MNIHTLAGCSPTPLAHYLKALGILRLVAEQKDESVRGWWRDETFHLASKLSRDELELFFLNEYQPTPLITPWNGGSGFYPKDNKSGIEPIDRSVAARFQPYREAIRAGRELTAGWKESPKDELKGSLLQKCRQSWRGSLLDWLEAALVLSEEGSPVYPALLGTGGNDGRLDFTNNFMQRLGELFDCESAEGSPRQCSQRLLRASMFADASPGLASNSIGQFFPGAAGGANSTIGFGAGALVNPWDFVLMLEGAIVFASALTRRMTTDMTMRESMPQAAAPFAVYASAAGFASAVDGEKSRGEQWMPLWNRPTTHHEMVRFVAEGRCQVQDSPGTKARTAQRPLDVARSIARLGVARGVSEFQRYGYIERNGQANLATPLGRWVIPEQPVPELELIDEIKPWFDQLQRAGGDKNAPASIGRAARVCENAMLACCRDSSGGGSSAARWQQLFVALGEAETQLVRSPGFTGKKGLQPLGAFISGLSPRWLLAINDGSPELRLALAFAGQHGVTVRTVRNQRRVEIDWNDPVRGHFMPLVDARSGKSWAPRRFEVRGEKLVQDTRVVCLTGDIERDAVALMRRRVIEARQGGGAILPLKPVPGTEASLADIQQFLAGELDAAKIMGLARPLMALDWIEFDQLRDEIRKALRYPSHQEERDAAGSLGVFGLLRLCHFPGDVPVPRLVQKDDPTLASASVEEREPPGVSVRLDPAIVARLIAGGVQQAVKIAARRLAVSGLRPKLSTAFADEFAGRRLVAALAFPVSTGSALRLVERLTRPVLPAAADDSDPTTEEPVASA